MGIDAWGKWSTFSSEQERAASKAFRCKKVASPALCLLSYICFYSKQFSLGKSKVTT